MRSAFESKFYGSNNAHSREHFARAVLEGVAFSLLDCVSVLEELSVSFGDIRIIERQKVFYGVK